LAVVSARAYTIAVMLAFIAVSESGRKGGPVRAQ